MGVPKVFTCKQCKRKLKIGKKRLYNGYKLCAECLTKAKQSGTVGCRYRTDVNVLGGNLSQCSHYQNTFSTCGYPKSNEFLCPFSKLGKGEKFIVRKTKSKAEMQSMTDLSIQTKKHITDVVFFGNHVMSEFFKQIQLHDHSKKQNMALLWKAIETHDMKDWLKFHQNKERHHCLTMDMSNFDKYEINLLDMLELTIDWIVAGKARSDLKVIEFLNEEIRNERLNKEDIKNRLWKSLVNTLKYFERKTKVSDLDEN
jgi:hypothetical protein